MIEEAFAFGPSQIKAELIWLCQKVEEIKPVNILEIGTKKGGTFYCWKCLSSNLKISVDLPNGPFGGINNAPDLTKWGDNIHQIQADSHKQETLAAVKNILGSDLLDFLFIDGDHTYEGVKRDFQMYSPLVRRNGLVAFHDIVDSEHHRKLGCEVAKFWKSLSGRKEEYCKSATWAGVGIIKMPVVF